MCRRRLGTTMDDEHPMERNQFVKRCEAYGLAEASAGELYDRLASKPSEEHVVALFILDRKIEELDIVTKPGKPPVLRLNPRRYQQSGGLTRTSNILPGVIKPTTRAQDKFLTACAEIQLAPDAVELAYLARELVQCSLPHSDPGGRDVWARTHGAVTMVVVRTGLDPKTMKLIGYPYGSIPRLLLCWMNTEAVRTGK